MPHPCGAAAWKWPKCPYAYPGLLDRRSLEIHRFALALRELHSLAVLLERLQRARIAAVDLRAGRKCINVVLARRDSRDLSRAIGMGPALAEQGKLPLIRRVRHHHDAGVGHWLPLVVCHRAFRCPAVCLQNDLEWRQRPFADTRSEEH